MRNTNYRLIKSNNKRLTPAKMIFFGFVLLILIGSSLLSLPFSATDGIGVPYIDALFTATSSVCVTGLVVFDTNTQWSIFGKFIILLLIQIGALGIMSVVTLFSVITGRSLGLSQRLALKESISNYSLANIVAMFGGILKATLLIEVIGAFVISFAFIPQYGWLEGIGKSIFHSISAFCNAGFDILGSKSNQFTSLIEYNDNPLVLITTSLLIIIGGLGFIVWYDLYKERKVSRYTLHTKIVLMMSVLLIFAGTVFYLFLEYDNTLLHYPPQIKLLNSYFHSVSARTAGFDSLNIGKMKPVTSLITILLMFIGAAPGSTGGGIKTTTFFILIITMVNYMKGKGEVQVFKRRITADIISKSLSIFLLSLIIIFITTLVLLNNEEINLLQALFESTSAFATVGLSTGITPQLCFSSKVMLIITMLMGRVGIITTLAAFTTGIGKENNIYRYPEGKITVG